MTTRKSLLLILFLAPVMITTIMQNSGSCEDRILYSTFNNDRWELVTIRLDGKGKKKIEWIKKSVRSPAVSPINFEIAAIDNRRNLCIFSKNKSEHHLTLPPGIYAQPTWNRDGTALSYVKYQVKPSDQSEIWQIRRGSSEEWQQPEQLTSYPPMRLHPSFSPDDRFLLYTEFRREKLLGVVEEIGFLDLKSGKFTQITQDKVESFHGVWSPDGKHIAYVSNKTGNYDIWLLSIKDGLPQGEARQLTLNSHFDGEPAWSPNSRQLVFVSSRSGSREIWTISVDSVAAPVQVTNFRAPCKEPVWLKENALRM
ncbi:MAG: hypothetical protein D3918_12275 [Candidatus Electrothrix sp. AX2]|nr:hypothetical protein [Candidatus Electrothrix gigas]